VVPKSVSFTWNGRELRGYPEPAHPTNAGGEPPRRPEYWCVQDGATRRLTDQALAWGETDEQVRARLREWCDRGMPGPAHGRSVS